MKYSKSTNGFYIESIHGDRIPADAVEITAEKHSALLQGQSEGMIIVSDENGFPFLMPQPEKTKSQLKQAELSALTTVFQADKRALNTAWLAAAVADGINEETRKAQVVADIQELQAQYAIDVAAIKLKYL